MTTRPDSFEAQARAVAHSMPIVDFGSAEAVHAFAAALREAYRRGRDSTVTDAMVRAAAESRARDKKGEIENLNELLSRGGKRFIHTVIKAALVAALAARGEAA